MSLRESLVEESAKEKEKAKNWETIAKRVLANLIFVLLLLGSAYLVIWVVERSQEKTNSWYRQNEITIVMSLIGMIMPMFFDLIALLEEFHPRKAMRWMLARIMALNLLRYLKLFYLTPQHLHKSIGVSISTAVKSAYSYSIYLQSVHIDFCTVWKNSSNVRRTYKDEKYVCKWNGRLWVGFRYVY